MGRRAPMHRMHIDCLHEIVNAGLMPVIGIGSTNGMTSPLYDPLKNPLTEEEQREQLRRVVYREFPREAEIIVPLIFSQEDLDHAEKWSKSIAQMAQNKGVFGRCVLHFRAKESDFQTQSTNIRALRGYTRILAEHGVPSWGSYNTNPDDDNIHASDMRKWDLNRLNRDQKSCFADPDYIIDLANDARKRNPMNAVIEGAGIPVTMLDLSLERMRVEAGMPIHEIIEQAMAKGELSLMALSSAAATALERLQKQFIPKPV